MSESERREHERIEIEMATRMWLDEDYRGKQVVFEGFAKTKNLAIGGIFLESSYLLPLGFPINLEMTIGDGEQLIARGEVVRAVAAEDARGGDAGMGIQFTAVDAENRERLLRFFVSDRIRNFYKDRFVVEFPHLQDLLSLQDIAIIINLWEDREERLTSLKGEVQKQDKPMKAQRSGKRR
jgi:hypothetical protein